MNVSASKKIFIVFAILIILSLILSVAIIKHSQSRGKKTALQIQSAKSAHLGWLWLKNYQNDFLDPGIPFIIKQINDRYCQSNEAEKFWQKAAKEFDNHEYLFVFERFFYEKNKINPKIQAMLKTPHDYYNDILPQALYCDVYPARADFEQNLFANIKNETEYDLTHKFWSAVLFKNNNCVSKNYDIEKIILSAAQKMAVEQEQHKEFNDLFAERAAFLLNYGFADLVNDEWIKIILENQEKTGAWNANMFFNARHENPHTTILAVWALTEYSKTCPF